MNNKVWFVTGASKGLGLTLAKKLLAQGYKVAATSRTVEALTKEIGTVPNFLPLQVDLVNEESVKLAIAKTVETLGGIDIVVNNAGFGQFGVLEELSDKESRQNFDINVFGSLNVIRQAMPYLRNQQSGHIFNISSVGGFTGNFSGWGIYCATKFAVAGFTEGLAAEVKEFNVHATVVYPGYFRTSFLSKESMGAPENIIAAYESARQSHAQHADEINNNQPGDPEKAADVMIAVAKAENPPVHLFLGKDAYGKAAEKIEIIEQDLAAWKSLAAATDLD